MALTCVSLTMSDAARQEGASSLQECPLGSLLPLEFVSLGWLVFVLYAVEMDVSLRVWDIASSPTDGLQIVLPSRGRPLMAMSSAAWELCSLMWSHLFILGFCCLCFWCQSQNIIPEADVRELSSGSGPGVPQLPSDVPAPDQGGAKCGLVSVCSGARWPALWQREPPQPFSAHT